MCEALEVQSQGAGGDAGSALQPTAVVWQPLAARPFQQLQPHAPGVWSVRDEVAESRTLAFGQGLETGWRLEASAREGSDGVQSSAEGVVFADPPASPPGSGSDRRFSHRVQDDDCDLVDVEVVGVARDAEGVCFGEAGGSPVEASSELRAREEFEQEVDRSFSRRVRDDLTDVEVVEGVGLFLGAPPAPLCMTLESRVGPLAL
ncbi:unnamed protein product [Prorocentrum cordatum]|uniref:Uncharacterized protein n=1 Tax=Prorocentrum cordatum TaxID=2364126 RepID=A0ABN9TZF5_9DINO|nr:unnamed protein product [Polarella glacialis]